jgi:glycine cleavage system H protein
VLAVNESLADSPEAVNRDAYGDGWIMQMKPADSNALNELMDAGEYQEFIAAE